MNWVETNWILLTEMIHFALRSPSKWSYSLLDHAHQQTNLLLFLSPKTETKSRTLLLTSVAPPSAHPLISPLLFQLNSLKNCQYLSLSLSPLLYVSLSCTQSKASASPHRLFLSSAAGTPVAGPHPVLSPRLCPISSICLPSLTSIHPLTHCLYCFQNTGLSYLLSALLRDLGAFMCPSFKWEPHCQALGHPPSLLSPHGDLLW